MLPAMETLSALFGSEARVKLMRLFLFNPDEPFFPKEVAARSRCSARAAEKELRLLLSAGLLRKRHAVKEVGAGEAERPGHQKAGKRRGAAFFLNDKFRYLEHLKSLLIVSSVSADASLAVRFAKAGRLKAVVACGVFVGDWDARVDLLIVGDGLNMGKIEAEISKIEAELGKEIAYSAFETADFQYRLGMRDRLVRDILDSPHTVLVDRIGFEPS